MTTLCIISANTATACDGGMFVPARRGFEWELLSRSPAGRHPGRR